MKRYLLDTNVLLWMLEDSNKLTETSRKIISEEKEVFVSDVSLWEIAIKISIGKLDMDGTIQDIEEKCNILNFSRLQIKSIYFERLRTLPMIHRDPFDRLLIAQAMVEKLALISSDTLIPQYDVEVVW